MLFRSLAAAAALLATPALAQEPVQGLDDAAYLATIRDQVAAYVQPTNAARTEVVLRQIREAGFEPEVEVFQGGNDRTGPIEGRNVSFVVWGVADPGTLPDILLTAHYDAVTLRDGTMSYGVVDNAASVVAVIRAAQWLNAKHLGRNVRVILFDQEELGLIGARKWIEANDLKNVAAVVNSDIAAYGDTMMYGQNNGAQSAFVTRAVQAVCSERALQCVGYPSYPPSDDRAFSAAGAPVVSLGFQDQIGAHQMWLAFNGGQTNGLAEGFVPQVFRLIHSAEDTMDNVDPATVKMAGETYAAVIEELDRSMPQ